jgi:hypothetical protein
VHGAVAPGVPRVPRCGSGASRGRRGISLLPNGNELEIFSGDLLEERLVLALRDGHRTGVRCWLVYQFLQPPTQTVPGNAVSRRARNFSVAARVGETAARCARGSAMSRMMQLISWSRPNGTGMLFTGANGRRLGPVEDPWPPLAWGYFRRAH